MSHRWALLLALTACTHTVQTSAKLDVQATSATVARTESTAAVVKDVEQHEIVSAAPVRITRTEAWDEELPPAPEQPRATPRKVHHPAQVIVERGPVFRESDTRSEAKASAATVATTSSSSTLTAHAEQQTKTVTRAGFGFQLFLVLLPLVLLALAGAAWKLRRFIPWIP